MGKLTDKETARLKELIAAKKAGKLTDSEKSELEGLNKKCGFKSKSKGSGRGRSGRNGGKISGTKRNFGNDIAWWNKVPVLFNSAVNYAFNHVPGTDLRKPGFEQDTNDTDPYIGVAGAVRVPMIPTFGVLGQASDPFNTVIRAIWLAERKKYRGLNSYEQSDVGMAIISILGAFGFVMRLERIYGILSQYKIGNRNIPYTLLASLGVTPVLADDLLLNIADFRSAINYLIVKLQPLCLPKGMSYLSDMDALLSNVYSDSKDHRAQSIVFDWDQMWVYAPYASSKGGAVRLTSCTLNGVTNLAVLVGMANTLIGDLLADEDITLICSDLLACFGEEGVEGLVAMPEDYQVHVEYSEEILHKWHNSTMCPINTLKNVRMTDSDKTALQTLYGTYSMLTDTYIYQSNNVITANLGFALNSAEVQPVSGGSWYLCNPGQESTGRILYGDQYVDTWEEVPSDVAKCEGVMFKTITVPKVAPDGSGGSIYYYLIESCPCEILGEPTYFTRRSDNSMTTLTVTAPYDMVANGYNLNDIQPVTKFDWHPIYFGKMDYANAAGIVSYDYRYPFGDLNNVTLVTRQTVYRIHEAALMSAFNIGVIANTLQE